MALKWNAILAGAGAISATWLGPLGKRDDVEIVAVVDPLRENAERRIREFNLRAKWYPTLAEALDREQAEVLLDCSIPAAHAANSILALSRGCHVLSEKPLAENVADARRIVAAAKAAKRTHAVIQNRRYLPEIIAYRDSVRKDIGELTTLDADFYLGAHFEGFRNRMEHVLLLDMAIHSFDQARMISGCDPVSVFCKEWNPSGSWYLHGAAAIAIFTMLNGMVFTYRGSWCAEGCNTPWECDWRAVGTEGSVCWRAGKIRGERVAERGAFRSRVEPFYRRPKGLTLTGHAGCIDEFFTCFASNGVPQTHCLDNIKSLAMVESAIRSAESGKEITIKL